MTATPVVPPTVLITETRATAKTRPVAGRPGRVLVQLITPGWGSSGYYAPEVLEQAADRRVFPAGTHMYLDHPTESEEYERPERSVRDLASVLVEDARWTGDALVAEAAVFGAYRDVLEEMADAIGVSIRASAQVTDGGVAEGRKGRIVNALVESQSVDYVTKAGRGGRVLQVLESARPAREASMRQTEELLSAAVRDAYGGEKSWTWVRDFDETTVWFQVETPDDCATYAQPYSTDAGVAALSGDRVEVRQQISYVPVAAAGAREASEEDPMPEQQTPATETTTASTEADGPTGQAAEAAAATTQASTAPAAVETATATPPPAAPTTSEVTSMTESTGAGGPAPHSSSPRQVLEARMQEQSNQIAQLIARERARDIIEEELAEAWVADSTRARLRAGLIGNLPLTESRELDEAALRTRCVEARDRAELEAAETLNAAGVGTPRGLGALTGQSGAAGAVEKHAEVMKEALAAAFGLSESAADIAVKGR